MSGFSYPEWIGDFYPPKTKREQMLAHYATRFDAVEINMTFRRDPAPTTIERWRDAVGPDFRFTFKAHMRITHWLRLVNADSAVAEFLKMLEPMDKRLGAVLFQVAAKLKFDPGVFVSFCASLPPGGPAYAFEPRDDSYAGAEVDDILKRHGIARCLNDDVFDPDTYRATAPTAYFRFHRDTYSREDIEKRAELVKSLAADGTDVYVFFAHEDNPESVRPALAFRELVKR
jgi:uncharacterized protein YecE (DUF72 family)